MSFQQGLFEFQSVVPVIAALSDATGIKRFNIKFFRIQHQMSSINIKKTQNCYQSLFSAMVPILHIHHRFVKPSVWLITAPSSQGCPFGAKFQKFGPI